MSAPMTRARYDELHDRAARVARAEHMPQDQIWPIYRALVECLNELGRRGFDTQMTLDQATPRKEHHE